MGEKAAKAIDFGLTFQGPIGYDLARMVARKNKVVEGLVKGVATLLKSWSIDHVRGMGQLVDRRTVDVRQQDGRISRCCQSMANRLLPVKRRWI